MSNHLPPAAALITHPVADFDRWKTGFDGHEPVRRAAGMLAHHINRAKDDPDLVTIFLALSDLDQGKAFASSEDLAATMQGFGVTGPPVIRWLQPVREAAVWDRQLPAFLLHHRVADFDRWLEGYDAAGPLQEASGIIGHAANRWIDDPAMVTVYHQAETFDALQAFLANPEVETTMKNAGVVSAPEIAFQIGGWAKSY